MQIFQNPTSLPSFISLDLHPRLHANLSNPIFVYYRVFIKYWWFFSNFQKYSGLWPFQVFPRCSCVYTHQAGRKPALQQNWQSSEKSQNFKEKTQYLMNPLQLKKCANSRISLVNNYLMYLKAFRFLNSFYFRLYFLSYLGQTNISV